MLLEQAKLPVFNSSDILATDIMKQEDVYRQISFGPCLTTAQMKSAFEIVDENTDINAVLLKTAEAHH